MLRYLLIGLGGFLGANARYLIGGWVADRLGSSLPYGTLVVNVTGSFIIGLFIALISERFIGSPNLRLFFAIGFLGAYTTFSTFSFESIALIESRAYLAAAANVVGSVVLSLVGVALGAAIGRAI